MSKFTKIKKKKKKKNIYEEIRGKIWKIKKLKTEEGEFAKKYFNKDLFIEIK